MPHPDPADHIVDAVGALLLRDNRVHLYARLTEGVDGLDGTTYPVLSGLARTGTVTATRLAAQAGLDRTVTTRYATRLELAGLVHRSADPGDGRAVRLSLTPAGERAVAMSRSALRAVIAESISDLTPREAQALATGFTRVVAALARSDG